jgi:excisionase family DNA binding protein
MGVLVGQLSLDVESVLTAEPAPEPPEEPEAPRQRRQAAAPVEQGSAAGQLKLLTVAEVAQLTGLSVNAVYRAIWSGELEGSKLRGRIRIAARAVDAWVDRGRISTRPPERPRTTRAPRRRPTGSGRGLRELLQTRDATAAP